MDPIVIIMDALRDVDDDLEALEVEKRRLQDRQELLRVRQASLQAHVDHLKSQA